MEYVAAGDISSEGVHMLSTGGMLKYAEEAEQMAGAGAVEGAGVERWVDGEEAQGAAERVAAQSNGRREVVVATETGMLHPLRMAAPDIDFIPANAEASCVYMKMITLPKLRDALRDMKFEVRVPPEIAARARVPIDRMVSLG
jgi:quinolinate synthase